MNAVIVSVPEPGMAHVLDRETRAEIGYVLQDFLGGWTAYWRQVPDLAGVRGPRFRYRADAVAFLAEKFAAVPRVSSGAAGTTSQDR